MLVRVIQNECPEGDMEDDIRLLVSFKGHRKRRRLKRILGPEATDYLIDFWLTIRTDCPDGVLVGWDELDIADAAGWPGGEDPKKFINALIDCKLLDINDDELFVVHDWDEHQGWACGSKQRSENARKAAIAKWEKKYKNEAKLDQCGSNAPAELEHQISNAPNPIPNPNPKPNTNEAFESFWLAYPKKKNKGQARKTWAKLSKSKSLPEIDDIINAINQAKQSPDWKKENGQYIPYPSTWLNAEGWSDETQPPQQQSECDDDWRFRQYGDPLETEEEVLKKIYG